MAAGSCLLCTKGFLSIKYAALEVAGDCLLCTKGFLSTK